MGLQDEFDMIECFAIPGYQLKAGEMTKKQVALHQAGCCALCLVTIMRKFRLQQLSAFMVSAGRGATITASIGS